MQPLPARVGSLSLCAPPSHAGLFSGLGRPRVHNETPGPRANPSQHSSKQLLILSAAPLLGTSQGLAGAEQNLQTVIHPVFRD
jgi:hypothetical protein